MAAVSSAADQWFRERSPQAFHRLVEEHGGMVYGTCLRILRNRADAEEAAQECFEALASAQAPPHSAPLGAWLHAVAVKKAFGRIRSDKRRAAREQAYAEKGDAAMTPHWDDVYPHVDAAIAELPEDLREPIVAHFLEQRTHADIARELGLTRSGVSRRIDRGLERLAAALRKRGIASSGAALGTLLGANVAHGAPMPASLSASLGKLALAQVPGEAARTAGPTIGGVLAMKATEKLGIALAALLVLLGLAGVYVWKEYRGSVHGPVRNEEAAERFAEVRNGEDRGNGPFGNPAEAPTEPAATEATQAEQVKQALLAALGDGDAAVASGAQGRGAAAGAEGEPKGNTHQDAGSKSGSGRPASISGYVYEAFPIPGAEVILAPLGVWQEGREDSTTKTNAEGFYRIDRIHRFGTLQVYAVADGYRTVSKQIELREGQRLDNVNIELKPGKHTIEGIVEDTSGTPIPGALVDMRAWYADPQNPNRGGNRGYPGDVARSDAAGRFTLVTNFEGYLDVLVNKEGYAPGFFPAIAVGTKGNRLVLEAPGSIAGTVRDAEGTPLPAMKVVTRGSAPRGGLAEVTRDPHDTAILYTMTDGQGRYRIDGLSSSFEYLVGVETDRDEGSAIVTGVRVEPGEVTQVDLTFGPLATLRVSVRSSVDGSPLSGIGVVVYSDPEVGDAGNTNASGLVTLHPPVERGTALKVKSRLPCPTGFIDAEGPETKTSLTLSPGGNAEVALTIHPPIRLPVRAVDEEGAGVPGMSLGLRLWDLNGRLSQRGPFATTGPDGYFVWGTLPAGWTYQVFVADPDSGKTLAESEKVETEIGAVVPEVVIRLITRGGIEGVVVDPSGQPFAKKPLTITYTTASGEKASVRTDTREDGYFAEIQGPEARLHESLRFEVNDGGVEYAATIEGVELYSGQIVNVGEVVLQPASPPPLPARS